MQSLVGLRKEAGRGGPVSPGLEGMAHCLAAVAEAVAEHHLLQDVAHYGDGSGQESPGGRKRGSQVLGA